MRVLSMLLLSTLGFAGSASAAGTTWNIKVGSTTRNAIVYVPTGLSKPAIVIQCHGMNQDAAYQQAQAKWEPIADTGKFLVVFPNGVNKAWDISGTTDVEFMKAIIDTMVKVHGADRDRVYLSGFSMGGMFTYHAMNKLSDRIAAFAPCSGYPMGGTTPASTRPVPILHIHGTTDDVVRYSGVEGVLSKWRTWNGCPTSPTTIKPYPAGKTGSMSARDLWSPCTKNGKTVEVALITNTGKGHWYSMDQAGAVSSVEIWNFSKRYSLASATSVERPRVGGLSVVWSEGRIRIEGAEGMDRVEVRDMAGHLVVVTSPGSSRSVSVRVGGMARGVYQVEGIGPQGRRSARIVVP